MRLVFYHSFSWTSSYPNTLVKSLSRVVSDHIPCVVQIETSIPKTNLFVFENFWVEHEGFFFIWSLQFGVVMGTARIQLKISLSSSKA